VDALLLAGHNVRVFDRSEDKFRGRLAKVDYVIGGFDDTMLLAKALTDIDVVFHAISTTVPSTSNLDPITDVQSNLVTTLRLLQLMHQMNVNRIVYLSSGGTVYGKTTVDLITEEHPLRPVCSYGVVKIAIENYLHMYQELHGLQPIILRPSNPYGERQGNTGVQGVIGTFLSKVWKHEQIEVWGNGKIIRDFIYVGDFAQACLKVIESKTIGTFNIGGGCGYSIKDIIDTIATVTHTNIAPLFLPSRGFDVNRVVLDIRSAQSTFDWQPKTSLNQGILNTWAWINSNGHTL